MSLPDPKIVQIAEQLEQRFFATLPELKKPGTDPEKIRQNKLTRSLAAFAIASIADVDQVTAAASVIDDFDDNGLDAVYFDKPGRRLLLAQSKFKANGGGPDSGETKKFVTGVNDLLAKRYDRFNEAFDAKIADIDDALALADLKITLVVAWTGDRLDLHTTRDLEDLKAELNKFHPGRCEVEQFGLPSAYKVLADEQAQGPVEATVLLENWYHTDKPFRAFYGQISVSQLAKLYVDKGKPLFERNIRFYMGSSGVNEAIAATLRDEPQHLFYLNNGLTAVCRAIRPLPDAKPDKGHFKLEGLSIVNGAQTVGSIASVAKAADLAASPARVLITLIELDNSNFCTKVTHARNYQNQVKLIDFAALDPVQERLRRELAISNIAYRYRPSQEARRTDATNFGIEDVAAALACFSGKPEFAVAVKKQASRLIDPDDSLYKALFSANTDAAWLYRAYLCFRHLNALMTSREVGAEKLFYRHMRYAIVCIVSRRSRVLRKRELGLAEDDKVVLSRELDEISAVTYTRAFARLYYRGFLALSRSQEDVAQVVKEVTELLAEQDAAAAAAAQAAKAELQLVGSQTPPNAGTN